MENIENLVTEEVTENVEQTTEETPKMYTEEEFNKKLDEAFGKRKARWEAKRNKEEEAKYGGLLSVLRAGTGKESVEEITDTFKEHYEKRGIKPTITDRRYSADDIAVLAAAEADEIIGAGFEEVVEEVDRLAKKGLSKMTDREKAVFKRLAEHRKATEESRELSSLGVTAEEYGSAEFKEFAMKFNPATPIKDVYNIYRQTKPQKEIKTAGSMKQTPMTDNGVKDFYSYEEASKFTQKDFDNNPALFKAVKNSMTKWK